MKPILREIGLLLAGLVFDPESKAEHLTLDPIRVLLLLSFGAAFFSGHFVLITVTLVAALTIGRFLAAYRDGTIKAHDDR